MSERQLRAVDRHTWEKTILRARLNGVIAGNAKGSRGGVSGAAFKAVAFAWSSHANPDGSNIYPGDATLAVESEVGLKAVKAIKAKMVELGLTMRTKAGARRLGQNDIYRLTLPVAPDLSELIEVLSPDGLRAAAVETYEKQRGVSRGSDGPLTTYVVDEVVQGPEDPQQTAVQGPVDPLQTERDRSQRGSGGPTDSGCWGSGGPVVGGPEDPNTKPLPDPKELPTTSAPQDERSDERPSPSPEAHLPAVIEAAPAPTATAYVPGASRVARRNNRAPKTGAKHKQSPLVAKPRRLPEAVEIIRDSLRHNGHPDITDDDARTVHRALQRQYGTKATPNYLRAIAANGGFAGHYAELREARAAEIGKAVQRLCDTEPECEHGTAAGRAKHPTTGRMLCPACRAGLPADEPDTPATPDAVAAAVRAYGVAYTEARGRAPEALQLVALTQQATGLHLRGADPDALTALAQRAGAAGIALLTAATQGGTP
jgi:hypothetical protein